MTRRDQLLVLAQDELETAALLLENNRYRACGVSGGCDFNATETYLSSYKFQSPCGVSGGCDVSDNSVFMNGIGGFNPLAG